ncbi:hypothetical protein [Flavobacterium sp.]|uniref:hypothetical protein n=1 Tax=Flavobacterium sp. TaxID=239 RepID=UPI0037513283
MKKIIPFLMLSLIISSCSLSDDGDSSFVYEILPLTQVDMPTAFAKDSTTLIPLKFIRPSSCHFFNDFYYEKDGLNRVVAIEAVRANRSDCQVTGTTETVNLKFRPATIGLYHFKFWIGSDSQGVDLFSEFDVDVNH